MRVFRFAVATALLLGAGCVSREPSGLSGLAGAGTSLPAFLPDAATAVPAGHGTLRIAVRWPLTYATQAIPANTASIALNIKGEREIQINLTPAQPATESVLPAGSYTLTAIARDPDGTQTASGSTGVTVLTGQIVNAGLTLSPHFVPALTRYQPNGGPGELITLLGLNFAPSGVGNSLLKVRFGAQEASEVFVKNDNEAHVRIPAGVVNGDLSVVANGVESTASYPFRSISSLEVFSPNPDTIVVSGEGRPTVVLYAGETRPAQESYVSLRALAKDSGGETVPDPYVKWRVLGDHSDFFRTDPSTGSACDVFVERGSFPGPGSATGTIFVESGNSSASVDYVVFK